MKLLPAALASAALCASAACSRSSTVEAIVYSLTNRFGGTVESQVLLHHAAAEYACDYASSPAYRQYSGESNATTSSYNAMSLEKDSSDTSAANLREPPVLYGVVLVLANIAESYAEKAETDLRHVETMVLQLASAAALLAPTQVSDCRVVDLLPLEKACISATLRTAVLRLLAARSDQWPGASSLVLKALHPHWHTDLGVGEAIIVAAQAVGAGALQAQTLLAAIGKNSPLAPRVAGQLPRTELQHALSLPLKESPTLRAVLEASESAAAVYSEQSGIRATLSMQLSLVQPGNSHINLSGSSHPSLLAACAAYAGDPADISDLVERLFALQFLGGISVRYIVINAVLSHFTKLAGALQSFLFPDAEQTQGDPTVAIGLFLRATENPTPAMFERLSLRVYPFNNIPAILEHIAPLLIALNERRSDFDVAFVAAAESPMFTFGFSQW